MPLEDAAPLGGRYEILRELGSGGMGRVYQARDRETGEVLALKVLRPGVAAEAGDATAQFRLGQMLFNGPEALRDESQAREWLTRAAEQGHADSQFAVEMMYEHGRGGARDLRAARSWFERAAASGHQGAQRSLARLTERVPERLHSSR